MADDTVTFELRRQEFDTLLLALGIATGAMFAQRDERIAYRILNLTNMIGRTDPDFRPYTIPEEFQHG